MHWKQTSYPSPLPSGDLNVCLSVCLSACSMHFFHDKQMAFCVGASRHLAPNVRLFLVGKSQFHTPTVKKKKKAIKNRDRVLAVVYLLIGNVLNVCPGVPSCHTETLTCLQMTSLAQCKCACVCLSERWSVSGLQCRNPWSWFSAWPVRQ